MHEISRETMARLFAESHRLLRPGGVAVHQDVPIRGNRTLFDRYMFAWETKYNNEPFWQVFAEADVQGSLAAAGFSPNSITQTELSQASTDPGCGMSRSRRNQPSPSRVIGTETTGIVVLFSAV